MRGWGGREPRYTLDLMRVDGRLFGCSRPCLSRCRHGCSVTQHCVLVLGRTTAYCCATATISLYDNQTPRIFSTGSVLHDTSGSVSTGPGVLNGARDAGTSGCHPRGCSLCTAHFPLEVPARSKREVRRPKTRETDVGVCGCCGRHGIGKDPAGFIAAVPPGDPAAELVVAL